MKKNTFTFTPANEKKIATILARYPQNQRRSATLPLLDLAQRQNGGWLSEEAIETVANFLEIPPMRVYEVASFYTMFNLKPVGKNLIQLCRTTSCWLRGSDELRQVCTTELGLNVGETSSDGLFTVMEVECLGACANAPVVQINDDYYEDLDHKTFAEILMLLKQGKIPPCGSVKGRTASKAGLALSMHTFEQKER